MSNDFDRILGHVRDVWHHRWSVFVIATVICLIGWLAVIAAPDRYEVRAKVYLDTQSMLGPLLKGLAANSNVTEQTAQVLRRTLLSRPFLEKVARETDMDLLAKTPEQFEKILLQLSAEISVSQDRREKIYTISYENKDPLLAKKVVESLLNLFVEGALGASRKDTTSTQKFLNEQIKEYEIKLQTAEDELKEFKQKNAGLMPDEGQNYFSQLNSAKEAVRKAKLDLDEAKNRRNELSKQLKDIENNLSSAPSSAVSGQSALTPLEERIRAAQKRLDDLLVKYTDEHPDIVSTRRILSSLEMQKKEQEELSGGNGRRVTQLVSNPVYQEIKVQLGTAEADVAALEVRVTQLRERENNLHQMVNTMPVVEASLARLNRDYDVLKRNYHELVERREAARLSQKAELSADDVQFTIMEPPRVPLVPVSPNRPILYTVILILGLGAGIGGVWGYQQLKPTFGSAHQISESLGLPVFGSVMLVLSPKQKARRKSEIVTFAISTSILFSVFGLLQIIQILGFNLRSLISG